MRWRPDTCACEFEFTVTTDADGNGTRALKRVLAQCSAHSGAGEEILAAAQADNRLKNVTTSRVRQWSGKEVAWRFNERRELVLTGIEDAALRGACATLDRVRVA